MGATTFGNLSIGKFKTARESYSQEVEEAEYEHGHDCYNGTISTTDGFYLTSSNPRYHTKAFYKWEDKMLDKMDKGDCMAVEIKGSILKKLKEKWGFKGKRGIKAFYFFGWARC